MEQEIPSDLRLQAMEDSIEREKAVLSTEKELTNALNQIREDYKKELRDALGSNANKYLAFHQKTKDRIRDMRSFYTPSPEGEKIRVEFQKRSLTEARGFINSLGINSTNIENIQKKYIAQSRSAVQKALNITEVPYVEATPADLPKQTSNPWTWKSPPYDGNWGYWYWQRTGGNSWVDNHQDRFNGAIGSWSGISLSGADDSDYSYTQSWSEIRVWFQMPAAGLVEAWAYLQCIDTPYSGSLSDEWGVSDASIQQLSMPYLKAVSPAGGIRYGGLRDYQRGEDDGSWSAVIANPGQYVYPHLFSTESYSAGQWVYLAIGVYDLNYFWVNDMSCSAYLTDRWFARNVVLRSTGAP